MGEISELEKLQAAARSNAETYAYAGYTAPPKRQILVITCMDARVDPYSLLGITVGDAHLLRNAGGRVSDDVLRSAAVSTNALGTRHILVIHHTECGMANASQSQIETAVQEGSGGDASGIDFLAIQDRQSAIESDVARLVECGLIPEGSDVSGWIVDVNTGELTNLVPARNV